MRPGADRFKLQVHGLVVGFSGNQRNINGKIESSAPCPAYTLKETFMPDDDNNFAEPPYLRRIREEQERLSNLVNPPELSLIREAEAFVISSSHRT